MGSQLGGIPQTGEFRRVVRRGFLTGRFLFDEQFVAM